MEGKVMAIPWQAGIALALAGCSQPDLGSVEPEVLQGTTLRLYQPTDDAVDLLVLVDDSLSMELEQENLTRNFGVLVETLTSPADEDGDGKPDHAPVQDLHVGIISTDMGAAGFPVCDGGPAGDDGMLQHSPTTEGCAGDYPTFLSYRAGDDPSAMDRDFACLATLGTDGCGFEQQLEAVTKALTTHANGANAGFLREDSLLAILLVTDEEDCSVAEDRPGWQDFFDTRIRGDVPKELRCYELGPQFLASVESYAQQILALRPDHPERIVMAGIVGVPLGEPCAAGDYDCLLALPSMQLVPDSSGQRLEPGCSVPGLGRADPPRRIVETIRQVDDGGGAGIVRSICEADFRPALEAISSLIQSKFDGACLARRLQPDADGRVECRVVETLATGDRCPAGRIDLGLDARDDRQCQVCQIGDGTRDRLRDEIGTDLGACADPAASGDYWRYVSETSRCPSGQIQFEGRAVAQSGSDVRLECLSAVGGPLEP
ncbi:MAG: hypothetical protein HYY06_07830 [Deltaproteobacteria bacterium]|nr:hypothetical protein [Deltaproteobacteria bacterium]